MYKNVNCIHADNPVGYCRNKNVKRSLFGIGARYCVKYDNDNRECAYHVEYTRPALPPSPRQLFEENH